MFSANLENRIFIEKPTINPPSSSRYKFQKAISSILLPPCYRYLPFKRQNNEERKSVKNCILNNI